MMNNLICWFVSVKFIKKIENIYFLIYWIIQEQALQHDYAMYVMMHSVTAIELYSYGDCEL